MAVSTIENTFRVKYMDEFKMDFERETAKLRLVTHASGVVEGSTVKFDIVDPSDTAIEKGRNGRVPASELGLSQVTATNKKIHKKYQIDNFDAFRGNPNIRAAMSKRGISSINKGFDQLIIDTLDATSVDITGTGSSGSAGALSTLALVMNWSAVLWNKDVPFDDGNVWAVVSPNAMAQLNRISEFKSADFIEKKIAAEAAPARVRYWQGINWMAHTGLTGRGTNSCKMYMLHNSAIGHMISGEPAPHLFDSEEDDYFGVRYDGTHAAAICLPRGVCRFYHDDTAAFA